MSQPKPLYHWTNQIKMEDKTEFPFKSLTVEPGNSWRRRVKAFKSAGWIGALG